MSYTGYPTSSQYRQWPAGSSATWPYMVESAFNVVMGSSATLTNATPNDILASLYFKDYNADGLTAGAIASWADDGLDGVALTQGTGGKQPVASATSFGGNPGVTFDGSDDAIQCTLATPIASGSRIYVWFVAQFTALPANDGSPWELADDPRTAPFNLYQDLTNVVFQDAGNGDYITVAADTSRHLFEACFIGSATARFVVDGTPHDGVSAADSTVAFAKMALGNIVGEGTPIPCRIRRIVVAHKPAAKTTVPTATQITMMRAIMTALV